MLLFCLDIHTPTPTHTLPLSFLLSLPVDVLQQFLTKPARNSYCRALASDGSDLLTLQYPGVGNLLATENGDWNDRVYSYQCFREEEEGGA